MNPAALIVLGLVIILSDFQRCFFNMTQFSVGIQVSSIDSLSDPLGHSLRLRQLTSKYTFLLIVQLEWSILHF